MSLNLKKVLPLSLALFPIISHALPIDWHGSFGVDSTMITDYRRINQKTASTAATADGAQEVGLAAGNKDSVSFQTYILKLAPDVIINDSATFKAELTTGYANGGFLGDSPSSSKTNTSNVTNYYYNEAGTTNLNVKKAYLELNSDTATWFIGRHSIPKWGLGAMYSDGKDAEGNNTWDRHAYSRDGVTAFFKFNNFYVTPFFSQSSNTGLSRSTDAKEFGSSFLYDNREKDIAFGLYYGKKSSNAYNTFYNSTINNQTPAINTYLGATNVKVTDIYLKKILGKFNFGVEVPLTTGDLGHVTSPTTNTTVSSKAILIQTNYQASDSWTFGLDAGDVGGYDGSNSKFSAAYLNPNFQIANLLFRYNSNAFLSNSTESVFDGNVTNAQYLKLKSTFSSEKWVLDFGLIHAKAKEVARVGAQSFNHTKNKLFTATVAQSDSLGTEFDFNAKYKWNKEVSIGTGLGYLMTGDYYAFTNNAAITNTAKNSLLLQINTIVNF